MPERIDPRKIMTGKDGLLFDGDGNCLVEINTFQAQVNINNSDYQPAGSNLVVAIMTGYSLNLTATETVVRDGVLLKKLVDDLKAGKQPEFAFQGKLQGKDGTFERVVYRNVVPDGNIDLQNVKTGDIINRAWNFRVNDEIDVQEYLGN
jgi:hypothetical protein